MSADEAAVKLDEFKRSIETDARIGHVTVDLRPLRGIALYEQIQGFWKIAREMCRHIRSVFDKNVRLLRAHPTLIPLLSANSGFRWSDDHGCYLILDEIEVELDADVMPGFCELLEKRESEPLLLIEAVNYLTPHVWPREPSERAVAIYRKLASRIEDRFGDDVPLEAHNQD